MELCARRKKKETLNQFREMNIGDYFNLENSFFTKSTDLSGRKPPGMLEFEGRWSSQEEEAFISFLETLNPFEYRTYFGGIDWYKISTRVSGRNAKQCKNKYYQLIKSQKIPQFLNTIDKPTLPPSFQLQQLPAFRPDQEESLANIIKAKIANKEIVTLATIQELAFKFFYSPLSLAEKASVHSFIIEGINIFDENGRILDQFLQEFHERVQAYFPDATNEPHSLMNAYNIPQFTASIGWAELFKKKHNFAYKKMHIERRGMIDQSYVEYYLEEVAQAIAYYGIDRVLNMDETKVQINNNKDRVLAIRSQETVTVNQYNTNDKEGTTVIATCSANKKFPLIDIAKGKTERSCEKYQIILSEQENPQEETNAEAIQAKTVYMHSLTGWTTKDIMISYLNWLSEQMNNEPFALILDVFKAHCDEEVKRHAEKLQIHLIYVPACGTGKYQPLDRRVFGIIKSKLRKAQILNPMKDEEDYKNRYAIVQQELEKAWDEISDIALDSAFWGIPNLDKFYESFKTEDDDESKDPTYVFDDSQYEFSEEYE